MVKYLYTKKFYFINGAYNLTEVESKRADIRKLVACAKSEASFKHKRIETIDPLVKCAKRLFPFNDEGEIYEYARTALRIILTGSTVKTHIADHQTLLFPEASLSRPVDNSG
jgi:hypothetical protein